MDAEGRPNAAAHLPLHLLPRALRSGSSGGGAARCSRLRRLPAALRAGVAKPLVWPADRSTCVGDIGVTAGEKQFMYVMAFTGFFFILWMKREAVSETRRRVGRHLREIDRPVDIDNLRELVPGISY